MTNNWNIIIIPLSGIADHKRLVLEKEWEWAYFGTDACLRESMIQKLGDTKKYSYAAELAKISLENKDIFMNWIADVGIKQTKPFWWGTDPAYKNPFASDLFYNFCLLVLVKKWIAKGIKNRLIVIEQPWLLRTCENHFNVPRVLIQGKPGDLIINKVKIEFFSWARLFLFLARHLKMWLLNKWFKAKYKKKFQELLHGLPDILLYTWPEERSFAGDAFSDPYLGKLKSFYEAKGLKTAFVVSPETPPNLMARIYRSEEIIPTLCFMGLIDIAKSFLRALTFKWDMVLPDCQGLNLALVFESERIKEKGKMCYFIAVYYAFYNFVKKTRLNCKALIYPFENQPWDKMAVLGMRQGGFKNKIVAYQHTVVPYYFLNYYLGESERGEHPEPDIILSNGHTWEQVLTQSGFTCPVRNGGSLRYNKKQFTDQTSIHKEKSCNILVLFSPVLQYTLDLLFYLRRMALKDVILLLKPHPDLPENIIRKYAGDLPGNFIFVDGALEQWLAKAGWAIHAGSTAALECLMNGIPIFKYLPERIDADPLIGLNISQCTVMDGEPLVFEYAEEVSPPDPDIIAEDFKNEVWEQVMQ